MSVGTNAAPVTEFQLTLEEQWAIHQAFLDYVETAERDDTDLPPPTVELAVLEKVEAGEFAFTAFELDRLRYECDHHADSDHAPDDGPRVLAVGVRKIVRRCRGEFDG